MAKTYTVKSGDTLSAIAAAQGVKVSDISGYKSGNPNLIYPGEVLNIGVAAPTAQPTSTAQPQPSAQSTNAGVSGGLDPNREYTPEELAPYVGGIGETWNKKQFSAGGNTYEIVDTGSGKRRVNLLSSQQSQQSGNYMELTQTYLDRFNEAKVNEKAAESELFKTPDEIRAEFQKEVVTPSGTAPEAPKLVDLFNTLRSDNDITTLETSLNDLKQQEAQLQAQLRLEQTTEEGKPVALGVIAGRQTEKARQIQIQLDFLGVQKARVTDELTTRYSLINTIINLTQTDYSNAKSEYETKYNQNLEIYKMITGQREKKYDVAVARADTAESNLNKVELTIAEWKRDDAIRAEESARSNLQIYANLIKEGNLSVDRLPLDAQLTISQLEVKSGLGVGFLSSVQRDNPNGEIKSITTRQAPDGTKYADIIVQMPDGSLSIQSQSLGAERLPVGEGGSKTKITPDLVNNSVKILDVVDTNEDKLLSKDEAYGALQRIIGLVGDTDTGKQLFDRAWATGGFSKWKW